MTTEVISALANTIRGIDGSNTLTAADLGERIVATFPPFFQTAHGADLVRFVENTNPDKRLGAGALAELIVAEFGLDRKV